LKEADTLQGAEDCSPLWRVIGASVRGQEHDAEGLPCQDFWAHLVEGDTVAICVCDGAGSARLSREGAIVVANVVASHLMSEKPMSRESILWVLRSAREALELRATADGANLADFACTLLAVWANSRAIWTAHLGDGVIVGRSRSSDEVTLVSQPQRGQYANETFFLTSTNWEEHTRVTFMPANHSLCLMTDGCQPAALESGPEPGPHLPFCVPLFDFAANASDTNVATQELHNLLSGKKMSQTSSDDKTLVFAHFVPEVQLFGVHVAASPG